MFIVTIGRNVGDVPMSSNKWAEYKREIHSEITYYHAEDSIIMRPMMGVGASDQLGQWEGKNEQACCWIVNEQPNHRLAYWLGQVAFDFDQECVGLIVGGRSILCFPTPDENGNYL